MSTVARTLGADGLAWESGVETYLATAPHCFAGPAGVFTTCLRTAFARWSEPFAVASAHAAAEAKSATPMCKKFLLRYLGPGGAGDTLERGMAFTQKDALERNVPLADQAVNQLAIPAVHATVSALRNAEAAC
jgi:hypothetical protein